MGGKSPTFGGFNSGKTQKAIIIINNNKEIVSPAGNAPKMSEQLLPPLQNASLASSAALISRSAAALMNDN